MSEKLKISELCKIRGDMEFLAVEGTITRVGHYHSASGQYGPYTFQDIELTDGQDKITAVFASRPELHKSEVGKRISIVAHNGEKGLTGLKTKLRPVKKQVDGKYVETGEKEVVLHVSAKATVNPATNMSSTAQEQPRPQPPQAPRKEPVSAPPPRGPEPKESAKSPEQQVKCAESVLCRFSNLYQMIIAEADAVREGYDNTHADPMPPAHFQAICGTFSIWAERVGIPFIVADFNRPKDIKFTIPTGDISNLINPQ